MIVCRCIGLVGGAVWVPVLGDMTVIPSRRIICLMAVTIDQSPE